MLHNFAPSCFSMPGQHPSPDQVLCALLPSTFSDTGFWLKFEENCVALHVPGAPVSLWPLQILLMEDNLLTCQILVGSQLDFAYGRPFTDHFHSPLGPFIWVAPATYQVHIPCRLPKVASPFLNVILVEFVENWYNSISLQLHLLVLLMISVITSILGHLQVITLS